MAKKGRINIRGSVFETVNLDYPVGRGGDNRHDDVMLVQAMFRLIGHSPGSAANLLGLSFSELPKITGNCDVLTQRAILAFQRKNSRHLVNADGVIHPSYENRKLSFPQGARFTSITLLHQIILGSVGDVVP